MPKPPSDNINSDLNKRASKKTSSSSTMPPSATTTNTQTTPKETSATQSNNQSRPKRQRVSIACDCCRKKKIKCDGKKPSCTNCVNNTLECVYTKPERKPKPRKRYLFIHLKKN